MSKQVFILSHDLARRRALAALAEAPAGHMVTIAPARRSLDQNARLHALLQELAERHEWQGRRMSLESWKALMVSGHAIATKQGGEVMVGLEGEFVAIRESTAEMSKQRSSSLIEYVQAWMAMHDEEVAA